MLMYSSFSLRLNGWNVSNRCWQKVSLFFSFSCVSHCSRIVKSQPWIPKWSSRQNDRENFSEISFGFLSLKRCVWFYNYWTYIETWFWFFQHKEPHLTLCISEGTLHSTFSELQFKRPLWILKNSTQAFVVKVIIVLIELLTKQVSLLHGPYRPVS